MKLETAIIFFEPGTKKPRKYRDIYNRHNFENFARRSGGWYVNWYDAESKKFKGRKWLVDFKKP